MQSHNTPKPKGQRLAPLSLRHPMKLVRTLFCAAAAVVAVGSASAATTLLPGIVKQELWYAPATRAQLEAGTLPASTNITYLTQWDRGDIADNYVDRLSGVVIPPVTGLYDFYFSIDDDGSLFLSTDSTAANKRVIGEQTSWSGNKSWTSGGNDPLQRNSATWTNSAGAKPFSGGIMLTGGQQYYLEVTQHEGGGGDNIAVTAVPHGQGVVDGEATTLVGSTIGIVITTPTTLSFTQNPSNTTAYVGTSARLRVVTSTDSSVPPSYQWRKSGANIPGATAANFTVVASTADSGSMFDCIATVPGGLSRTSTVATVTVAATGALTVNGYLKRELFAGYTTANVRTNVEIGNVGQGTVTAVNQLDVPTAGANYAERVSGYFTPATSGNYNFFLAADDDSDFFISTDTQPANKRLVATQIDWSNNRSWLTAGGGNDIITQRRSDSFTPDEGLTMPYSAGIPLVGGTRYYIEGVHRAGGGGNGISATFITSADLASLGAPADNSPSAFTNGVISYVTSPVTSFSVAPLASVNVFEGLNYKFGIAVTTDSEVSPSYQWKRGGVAIAGATSPTYSAVAALTDNGASFSVDIIIPGFTNVTSTSATLTVQQSVFAEGTLKVERWNDATVTRAIISANAAGTVPEADSIRYISSGFDFTDTGADYVLRLSGFFVPATTGNYVFYVAADDDSDVFIGTNDKPETKRLIAQEGGWSGNKNWNTVGGGGTVEQRRSDMFSPDAGATIPYAGGIALTAGTRYYIEAVNHQGGGGQNVAVTYTMLGDVDPVNGSASKLTGARVGVLVPAATVLNITQDAASASALVTGSVTFSVNATNNGLLPTTYQWSRGGTAIAGATGSGFSLVASSSDNGAQFSCVMSVPGTSLSVTSSVATLTIASNGSLVSGQLAHELWSGNYSRPQIETGNSGAATTVNTVTNIDIGSLGDNYVQRVRGYFIPATTGKYTFFLASDDDSDLFLSTNDQPSAKRLIAHQNNWAGDRAWTSTGNGDPIEIAQKRSDQWVPDPANPPANGAPYAGGISLTAGTKYYIEAVHAEGGGGDNLGVTFKFDPTSTDSAADPMVGDPSVMFGSIIGYLAAPAGQEVIITHAGNSVNVSWAPAGGRLISSPVLGTGAVWTSLGSTNPQVISVQPGSLFFQVVTP